jgi:exopolysaccharide biosynthesis polyprenyl glycosylphosphotransferase
MIHQRSAGIYYLHIACQIVLVVPVFWLLVWLVDYRSPGFIFQIIDRYAVYNLCIVAGLIFSAGSNPELISNLLRRDFPSANKTAIRQVLFSTGFLLFVLVVTKDRLISRLFLVLLLAALYVVFLTTNRHLPRYLARLVFRRLRQEKTLLVGTARKAGMMREWLQLKRDFGLRIVGLITYEMPELEKSEYRILGGADDLERVFREQEITQVIVVEFPYFANMLSKFSELCERHAIRLLVVTDFQDKFSHSVDYIDDDGLRFITLRKEPLESPFNRVLKRTFDIVVSAVVCLTILPLLLPIVWLMQRWQSPGPLLHRQMRAGIQNRPFTILKFRTMHEGDYRVDQQATSGDERIYSLGRFLRRFSIDELPQFLNVLQGKMSVVGPRPHLIEHNSEFATVMKNYHVRSFVKPGITGLAQVRGFRGEIKSDRDLEMRIQSDIYYLENWSLNMDLMIVTRTLWQCFMPSPRAY